MGFEETIKQALIHRNEYLTQEIFGIALDEVSGAHGINARRDLHHSVSGFLRGRSVKYNLNLDSLIQNEDKRPAVEDVMLLGEALHFARKNVLTNYEIVPGGQPKPLNPLTLMDYTFGALAPSNNRHAAKFLENMCELMSKDRYAQERLSNAVSLILADMIHVYRRDLAGINFPETNEMYSKEKAPIDQAHMEYLNKFVLYARTILAGHQNPSIEDFYEFAGVKVSGSAERKVPTASYIAELFTNGNGKSEKSEVDYTALIARIEAECGKIIGLDWSGHKDHSDANIHLLVGKPNSPVRHSLTYTKGDVARELKLLYLAMCDHALSQSTGVGGFGHTTSNARKNIEGYL